MSTISWLARPFLTSLSHSNDSHDQSQSVRSCSYYLVKYKYYMSQRTLDFRSKHPKFVYERYAYKKEGDYLVARFLYKIETDFEFEHIVKIPLEENAKVDSCENLIFSLGLIIAFSYWKVTCSPSFHVEAASLSDNQISWWHNLLLNGLGEFFVTNEIDFTEKNFVTITSKSNHQLSVSETSVSDKDLVLISGGKESAVTVELLKNIEKKKNFLHVGNEIIRVKPESVLHAESIIDDKLRKLNNEGYLNGHTPISALFAFLSVTCAFINGYANVICSNEKSANEPTTTFKNFPINHQYSKSIQFEEDFRNYILSYVTPSVSYFSLFRPLYELQISKLLSRYPEHLTQIRSCNVGVKEDRWCLKCAKCAFVFLSLFPFVDYEKIKKVFGEDLFLNNEILEWIEKLVNLQDHKPFECVGTYEESILAVLLSLDAYDKQGHTKPPQLVEIGNKLISKGYDKTSLQNKILKNWDTKHFLPKEYEEILRKEIGL